MKNLLDKNLITPIWDGNVVYFETCGFLGEEGEANLIYTPTKIILVTDYGVQKNFVEGVDYIIKGNVIKRVKGGSMPYFKHEDLYCSQPKRYTIDIEPTRCKNYIPGINYLNYGEGDTFTKNQFCVTYEHAGKWHGTAITNKSDILVNSNALLSSGKSLDICVYGDSICTGCNSSGTEQGGFVAPYLPPFTIMMKDYLEKRFKSKVGIKNVSVGGWDTITAIKEFKERVLSSKSDLFIIGFGMNDLHTPLQQFTDIIEEMITEFKKLNPSSEVILIATTLPNMESNWVLNQTEYIKIFKELEKKYSYVAVANMTDFHRDLFSVGKGYKDIGANNINHPNDFVCRCYGQVILQTLCGL